MQSIEYNKENHPVLNQIYDILAELQAQDKKITLCKVLAYMRIEGNEEADKAAKVNMHRYGLWSAPNRGTSEKIKCPKRYKNTSGKGL